MITLLLAGMCLQETKAERLTAWVVEAKVKGKLTATFSNQDYPFEYEGWTTLTAAEIDELRKDGKVGEELAKRVALAFAEPDPAKKSDEKDPRAKDPKTTDKIAAVELTVKEGAITGKVTITREEGPGTRKIVAEISGTITKEKLTLKLAKPAVTGTWDWGGGLAELKGSLDGSEGASRLRKE
jgi:hypothetical protein